LFCECKRLHGTDQHYAAWAVFLPKTLTTSKRKPLCIRKKEANRQLETYVSLLDLSISEGDVTKGYPDEILGGSTAVS